jgi:hypothetical protein
MRFLDAMFLIVRITKRELFVCCNLVKRKRKKTAAAGTAGAIQIAYGN